MILVRIKEEDLEIYSRKELKTIIMNLSKTIDRFKIVPDFPNNTFWFYLNGKMRNASVLVDMWDRVESKSICDECDYKIKSKDDKVCT